MSQSDFCHLSWYLLGKAQWPAGDSSLFGRVGAGADTADSCVTGKHPPRRSRGRDRRLNPPRPRKKSPPLPQSPQPKCVPAAIGTRAPCPGAHERLLPCTSWLKLRAPRQSKSPSRSKSPARSPSPAPKKSVKKTPTKKTPAKKVASISKRCAPRCAASRPPRKRWLGLTAGGPPSRLEIDMVFAKNLAGAGTRCVQMQCSPGNSDTNEADYRHRKILRWRRRTIAPADVPVLTQYPQDAEQIRPGHRSLGSGTHRPALPKSTSTDGVVSGRQSMPTVAAIRQQRKEDAAVEACGPR